MKRLRTVQLNALRAFEAAARHQSFTKAADELSVSPGAISHHIKGLEVRLGLQLFRRLPQGLVNTAAADELLPAIQASFYGIVAALEALSTNEERPSIQVAAVNTLAVTWLLPRLSKFRLLRPDIAVELSTHNNWRVSELAKVDILSRFGSGIWAGTESFRVGGGTVTPLCTPAVASLLKEPADLRSLPLLRTFHQADWRSWCAAAGLAVRDVTFACTFDTSLSMIAAACSGAGIAIASPDLFRAELDNGSLVQPFPLIVAAEGAHYLTRPVGVRTSGACEDLWSWLREQVAKQSPIPGAATEA